VALYALALGLSIMLVASGKTDLGVQGTLLVLTLGPVALLVAHHLSDRRQRVLLDKVEDLTRAVKTLTDQSGLSNDARRVLNRQAERDLLRLAIEEDIENRNWDAAMVLVKELAENFGYRSDAEEFRRKIEQAREQTQDRDVGEAIAYLDTLIINRRWDSAFSDAARVQRLYPDSPRVEGLKDRVDQARASYKTDLERRFMDAANEGRADEAMTLLRELDFYLTVEQAEPLREMARGVIGKARDRLGEQFKQAVQDKRWAEAVRTGERIIADFPNTRMAAEVRDVIDGIRIRASEMQPA
jgi:tetratricopeptide (TPR) repeat protein